MDRASPDPERLGHLAIQPSAVRRRALVVSALAFWRRPLLSDEVAKKKGVRDQRAVARERHGLFRCGAFAAARLHAHRSKMFGSGIPIMSPRARTPGFN